MLARVVPRPTRSPDPYSVSLVVRGGLAQLHGSPAEQPGDDVVVETAVHADLLRQRADFVEIGGDALESSA